MCPHLAHFGPPEEWFALSLARSLRWALIRLDSLISDDSMNDDKYKTWMRAARRKRSKLFGKRLLWFFFAGQKMPPPPPIERLPGKVGTKVAKGGVWWIRWLADNDSSTYGSNTARRRCEKISPDQNWGNYHRRTTKKTWTKLETSQYGKKSFLCFWIFTPVITGGGRDRYIYRFPLSVSFLPLSVSSEPQLLFCLFYFCQMQVCERRKTRKGEKPSVFFAFTVKSAILITGN